MIESGLRLPLIDDDDDGDDDRAEVVLVSAYKFKLNFCLISAVRGLILTIYNCGIILH